MIVFAARAEAAAEGTPGVASAAACCHARAAPRSANACRRLGLDPRAPVHELLASPKSLAWLRGVLPHERVERAVGHDGKRKRVEELVDPVAELRGTAVHTDDDAGRCGGAGAVRAAVGGELRPSTALFLRLNPSQATTAAQIAGARGLDAILGLALAPGYVVPQPRTHASLTKVDAHTPKQPKRCGLASA